MKFFICMSAVLRESFWVCAPTTRSGPAASNPCIKEKSMPTKRSSTSSSRKQSATKETATGKKSSTRKYGPKASTSVEREMKAFKQGKLKSGSGRKVTSRKQAVAIGLSEARKSGAKVPAKKSTKS